MWDIIKLFLITFILLTLVSLSWLFYISYILPPRENIGHKNSIIKSDNTKTIYQIIIFPYTHFVKELPIFSENDKVVVVNQTEQSLGFEYEFKVSNTKLTIKELEEIGRNLVPKDANINYIYI